MNLNKLHSPNRNTDKLLNQNFSDEQAFCLTLFLVLAVLLFLKHLNLSPFFPYLPSSFSYFLPPDHYSSSWTSKPNISLQNFVKHDTCLKWTQVQVTYLLLKLVNLTSSNHALKRFTSNNRSPWNRRHFHSIMIFPLVHRQLEAHRHLYLGLHRGLIRFLLSAWTSLMPPLIRICLQTITLSLVHHQRLIARM